MGVVAGNAVLDLARKRIPCWAMRAVGTGQPRPTSVLPRRWKRPVEPLAEMSSLLVETRLGYAADFLTMICPFSIEYS